MASAFGLLRCSTEPARPSGNRNNNTTQSSSTSQPQSATEAAAVAATTATSSSFVARTFFSLNSRLVPPLSYLGVAAPQRLSSATVTSTASLSNPIELRDLRVSHSERDSEWAEKSIESFVEKTSEKADEEIIKEDLSKSPDLDSPKYRTLGMNFTPAQRMRARVLAVGAAVVIISSTLIGAGLKEQQQVNEKLAQRRESSLEEQITILESQKVSLYKQRDMVQRKLDVFKERVRERNERR
ncbi:hypothetical protein HOO65_040462 [Ceratocystis lukuohia]|uniref:Uncharacterized protein n=1 Tax=Ceratocystis lukuohia TaxID=2019550 RepID=A0ABR4MIQ4_9PEZI